MSDLERQQGDFLRAIMAGDDSVLAEIVDSPRERRDVLFGVYRFAYVSRLVGAIRKDYEYLHEYLGDEMFDAMGESYVTARPSQQANLRWFSQDVPEFLKTNQPYSDYPVLAELAVLERAISDAFDAPDAPVIIVRDLAGVPPEAWNDLRFEAHPSARRLDFSTNAAAVWIALKKDEMPPDAIKLDEPSRLLVWRQDEMPKFRELPAEEGMMWDEATAGIPFGVLCSMLATYDDPDSAAARGAGYLHNWVTTELLTGLQLAAR
jgi:hypothetical protein